ncbi:hypothetical protein GEMRC1_006177 [Eukaryota sp. GEM-RC1]
MVPFVCDVSFSLLNVTVKIGNQSSNNHRLIVAAPSFDHFPPVLSPIQNNLVLTSTRFGYMVNCFDNTEVYLSGSNSSISAIGTDHVWIDTGPLLGDSYFSVSIQFTPQLITAQNIPVSSLEATDPSFVCFVNIPCHIEIYSRYNLISMDSLAVTTVTSFTIVEYSANSTLGVLIIVSNTAGSIQDLTLCDTIGCYVVFHLPIICQIDNIQPRVFQWFGSPITEFVSITVEGIEHYNTSIVQDCLMFNHIDFTFNHTFNSVIVLNLHLHSPVVDDLYGRSFESEFNTHLDVRVDNFVVIPPVIEVNSILNVQLLSHIENLYLNHGSTRRHLVFG